jgi:hypothetical protein
MRAKILVIFLLLMFSFIRLGYSVEPVVIEFLYYEPCNVCPEYELYYQAYLHNKDVVTHIL